MGYEFKFADQPKKTKSIMIVRENLMLDFLTVVHPGEGNFPLGEGIRAVGLKELLESF